MADLFVFGSVARGKGQRISTLMREVMFEIARVLERHTMNSMTGQDLPSRLAAWRHRMVQSSKAIPESYVIKLADGMFHVLASGVNGDYYVVTWVADHYVCTCPQYRINTDEFPARYCPCKHVCKVIYVTESVEVPPVPINTKVVKQMLTKFKAAPSLLDQKRYQDLQLQVMASPLAVKQSIADQLAREVVDAEAVASPQSTKIRRKEVYELAPLTAKGNVRLANTDRRKAREAKEAAEKAAEQEMEDMTD
ncbi:hypothetical protein KIPB_000204 [Kipferlia bialata]|uniref:SWIM-type domain-containing protein n=1 Tax=Kipferlia bialata TaxID=797122 RepID=A0A9K3CN25_9EUKA|nr:hypothetical protein KIPB_000204 [Kipferlia bialata]|eukprot:g204.t1